MQRARTRALFAAKLLVSAGLLALVLRAALAKQGAHALLDRLGALDARFVALAVALQCTAVVLGTVRWRQLLVAHGMRLAPAFLLRSYLVGRFVAAFTPSTAGLDAYRVVDVGRATGDTARAGQVVLVEKCVGVLALALVAGVTGLAGTDLVPARPALLAAGLAVAAATAGLALLARPALFARVLRVVPGTLGAKLRGAVSRLPAGGLSAGTLALSVLLGLGGHLAIAATFVATGRALHVSASDGALLVVGASIVAATLAPISIGGVGVREGVAAVLLARVGVPAAEATLVAVLGYLAGQVPAIVGGIAAMLPREAKPAPAWGWGPGGSADGAGAARAAPGD